MAKPAYKLDYDFKCSTPVQYEIELRLSVAGSLFNKIYTRSKFFLRHAKKLKWKEHEIDEFDVSPQFYNLVRTYCKGYLKKICEDVLKDNIVVVTTDLISAKFKRIKENWQIILFYGGDYYDKK